MSRREAYHIAQMAKGSFTLDPALRSASPQCNAMHMENPSMKAATAEPYHAVLRCALSDPV